ncbi:MAG: hypothetical protein IJK47_04610 [Lachnospiraceae bacterium]|nr:hypothetical protein [Lachnospiraceae bacterium]
MHIGIIHATVNAVAPVMRQFKKTRPDIIISNYVDEGLLAYADEKGQVSPAGFRKFLRIIDQAIRDNVDGILIACSVYCQYKDLFSGFTEVPLTAIDEYMIAAAVTKGSRIGAIATTNAAIPVVERQLLTEAAKKGKKIQIRKEFLKDASACLRNGEAVKHDEMIGRAAMGLINDHYDVVVLAQVSMTNAKEKILASHPEIRSDQILVSLESGVDYAVKRTEEGLYEKTNSNRVSRG